MRFKPDSSVTLTAPQTTNLLDSLYNSVNATVSSRMGRMVLNNHHNFNIFTKSYLDDLHRALYGLEFMGDDINAIYFTAKDEHTFSRGTDFKTLHHHAKNKDMDPIVDYLNTLFNFQIAFARNNKPLISDFKGKFENSANCLVGSAGISCISHNSELVFNETSKKNKLVPHAGASYHLTRMPGELGTFLALTGTPFTGSEAKEMLGLADHIWHPDMVFLETFSRSVGEINLFTHAEEVYGTDGLYDNVNKYKFEAKHRKFTEELDLARKYELHKVDMFDPTSIDRANYTEKINDQIDMEYKQLLREDLEHKVLHDATKLGSGTTGTYLNYYQKVVDYFKTVATFDDPEMEGSVLAHYETQINR